MTPPGLDRLAHAVDLVAAEIVADDDVANPQHGAEHLLDIGQERRTVDCAVEHQWRHQAVLTQTTQECRRVPVPIRHRSYQALTATGAATAARHVGRGPSLIEKDQPRTIEPVLQGEPRSPCFGDVGPVLLGRANALFLSVRPSRPNVSHITGWLTVTPCS